MTRSVRASSELHRVEAYGLIDNDGRTPESIASLKSENIYPIEVHSVEALYYHPETIKAVANHLGSAGFNLPANVHNKIEEVILKSFSEKKEEFIADAQMRKTREYIFARIPTAKGLAANEAWGINHDDVGVVGILGVETAKIEELLETKNTVGLVTNYNLKKTSAPNQIAKLLGLANRHKYEDLVRSQARKVEEFKNQLKELVGVHF